MHYLKTHISYRLLGSKNTIDKAFSGNFADETISIKLVSSDKDCELQIHTNQSIEITELYHLYSYTFHAEDKIMCNGFQSWTETKEYTTTDKIKRYHPLIAPFSKPFGDASYYHYPEKKGFLHAWSYAYIRNKTDEIFLIASNSDEDAFTLIEFEIPNQLIKISKDIQGCVIHQEAKLFSLYFEKGKEETVFQNYFHRNNFNYQSKKTNGWTSWYHYYTAINENIIQQNLENFITEQAPKIDIFQIDDGWQKDIGNWKEVNHKFPKGLNFFTTQLHQKNIQAGLWLAPFICEKKSVIYKNHPEWILRDKNNKMVKAGYNPGWSGTFYALDFYHVEVRNYLEKCFEQILNDWNFDMLKLDFLYAVCLQSRPDKTRGAIMYEAMQWIRNICGNKLILACGVPLMPCAGQVDYCRIGPDISLGWNEFSSDLFTIREGISTRKSVGNTIARRHLDGYWFGNDPDVFILRNEKQKMSWDERKILFDANTKFGSLLFTSDNIANYTEEMKALYSGLFRK